MIQALYWWRVPITCWRKPDKSQLNDVLEALRQVADADNV